MKNHYPKKGQLFKAKQDFICLYRKLYRNQGDRLVYRNSIVMLVDIIDFKVRIDSADINKYRFHFLLNEQLYETEPLTITAWYQRFTYLPC